MRLKILQFILFLGCSILFVGLSPSQADATVRVYGRVYYQAADGSQIGLNGINIKYDRVRDGNSATFYRTSSQASWFNNQWVLHTKVNGYDDGDGSVYCEEPPDSLVPVLDPNGWYVFKSTDNNGCQDEASPTGNSQDVILCSNESDIFTPIVPNGYSFPPGVPQGGGRFEPLNQNGIPDTTDNGATYIWNYRWIPDSQPSTPPVTPVLSASCDTSGSTPKINLSWTGGTSTDTYYYRIFREDIADTVATTVTSHKYYASYTRTNCGVSGNNFCSEDNSQVSSYDHTVAYNTPYTYQVRANSISGSGHPPADSNQVSITCSAPTPTPTPKPIPILDRLLIDPDPLRGGTRKGEYSTSGKRSNQTGSNYFNAIKIQQNVDKNGDVTGNNIVAVITAFSALIVDSNGNPIIYTSRNLINLKNDVSLWGGFILLYANTCPGGNCFTNAGVEFPSGSYWVYNQGVWTNISNITLGADFPLGCDKRTDCKFNIQVHPNSNPPTAPLYSVQFFESIGNKYFSTKSQLIYTQNDSTIETGPLVNKPACDVTGGCTAN